MLFDREEMRHRGQLFHEITRELAANEAP
jgi:hypothetical protein